MDQLPDAPLDRLLAIMERLRDPQSGCPWDQEQTFKTIAPYTIEEAYEVAAAIADGDHTALREELGDLLFQVVYHAQMAKEMGAFAFDDVVTAIADKMVARHPHVFGDLQVASAAEQSDLWETRKAQERAAKAEKAGRPLSVLDDVPLALPALQRSEKLQKRAARLGFAWPSAEAARRKLDEELAELDAARTPDELSDELGDVLFSAVSLARVHGIDPEQALRDANRKFEQRFRLVETIIETDGDEAPDLETLLSLWRAAKRRLRDDAAGE